MQDLTIDSLCIFEGLDSVESLNGCQLRALIEIAVKANSAETRDRALTRFLLESECKLSELASAVESHVAPSVLRRALSLRVCMPDPDEAFIAAKTIYVATSEIGDLDSLIEFISQFGPDASQEYARLGFVPLEAVTNTAAFPELQAQLAVVPRTAVHAVQFIMLGLKRIADSGFEPARAALNETCEAAFYELEGKPEIAESDFNYFSIVINRISDTLSTDDIWLLRMRLLLRHPDDDIRVKVLESYTNKIFSLPVEQKESELATLRGLLSDHEHGHEVVPFFQRADPHYVETLQGVLKDGYVSDRTRRAIERLLDRSRK